MTDLDIDSLALVTGGAGLLAKAKTAAVGFAAGANNVSPSTLRVTGTADFGVEGGRRWFGVGISNGESVNVGLTPKRGLLRHLNYVTDGL
jgi:hypothetical protein